MQNDNEKVKMTKCGYCQKEFTDTTLAWTTTDKRICGSVECIGKFMIETKGKS